VAESTAYLNVLGKLLLFLQNTDRLQQEKIMSEVVLPLLQPNTDCLQQALSLLSYTLKY
jgi:hypothetical protein